MFKKSISKKAVAALTAALLATAMMPMAAFADDTQSFLGDDSGQVQVTATVAGSYSVELPALVTLEPTLADLTKYVGHGEYKVKGSAFAENDAVVFVPGASVPEDAKQAGTSQLAALASHGFTIAKTDDPSSEINVTTKLTNAADGTTNNGYVRFRSSTYGSDAGANEVMLGVNDGSATTSGWMYMESDPITSGAGSYAGAETFSWQKANIS